MIKTTLMPIPLEGKYSSEIESLSSYIYRSAHAHGVSVGKFLQHLPYLEGDSEPIKQGPGYQKLIFKRSAQKTEFTVELRYLLSRFTGEKFPCPQLDFLYSRVGGLPNEITGFRWCPECLEEMAEEGSVLYVKQIWHFSSVKFCPVHRTPLIDSCPECGERVERSTASQPLGICQSCVSKLYPRKGRCAPLSPSQSRECLASDIVDIFERSAQFTSGSSTAVEVPKYYSEGVDRLYKVALEHFKANKAPKERIERFRFSRDSCKQLPSLLTLRRFAFYINMSLYDLLTFEDEPLQLPLYPLSHRDLPKHLEAKSRLAKNHDQLYEKLRLIIVKSPEPPSLKRLAKIAGVSCEYIEYQYPNIAQALDRMRRLFTSRQSREREQLARLEAIKLIEELSLQIDFKSKKFFIQTLRERTGLTKRLLGKVAGPIYSQFKRSLI